MPAASSCCRASMPPSADPWRWRRS
jgi:hypothetical protein